MTDLWLPKTKELILPVRLPATGVRGRYKIEAINKFSGKRRVLADWFANLITTNGANLYAGSGWANMCAVGSGNATPQLTDTALQTLVASQNGAFSSVAGTTSSAPWAGSLTLTYRFDAGVAAGNLSEVGVGSSATNLFSRALILDGGGNPTTVTVLPSEALDVTYKIFQYSPTADVVGVVNIGGVGYAYTLRAALASGAATWAPSNSETSALSTAQVTNGAIAAVTGSPSGSSSSSSSNSTAAYSSGSFTRTATSTWGLPAGNLSGGITAALFSWGSQARRGAYQVGFSPAIPKDGTKVLTLSVSHSWAINTP